MKNIFFALMFLVSLYSCQEEVCGIYEGPCSIPATVVDMSGLDGCGYMLKLNDGDLLYPIWQWGFCGTPPLPEGMTEDPLYNFEFVDGMKVMLSYELPEQEYGNICMNGLPVIVTCLEEMDKSITL